MKKVSIFGVGNVGVRVAYLLSRSRDIAEIRLVDVHRRRSEATLLDFVQSNVALRSKVSFASPVEAKEILETDVVIITASVASDDRDGLKVPDSQTQKMMEDIITNISHFAPQSMVAVVSQPAEILCRLVEKEGGFPPEKVFGFPLLINREWFRDEVSRHVGVDNSDVRISTVRTLEGEEFVPEQSRVGGIPLSYFVADPRLIGRHLDREDMRKRRQFYHYSPAAVIAETTTQLVNGNRLVATAVVKDSEKDIYVESKSVIGPNGVERLIPLTLSEEQRARRNAYEKKAEEVTRELDRLRG